MHPSPHEEAVTVSLYRQLSSERAAIETVNWRPSRPVIGREFHVLRPVESLLPVRSRPHRYAVAYLTAFLVLASIFAAYTVPVADYPARVSYNLHSPITIDGNADLLVHASDEGWGGTGVAGDPIEIRDYEIDASVSPSSTGISIVNTTLYVSVDSCYIYDGYSFGIYLRNTTNVTISKCIIELCGDGIYLLGVSDSIVADTQCSNSNNGMYVEASAHMAISNVTCAYNAEGVYAYNVTDANYANCSFHHNSDTGIWLESCNMTSIDLCHTDNNDYGMSATDCYWMMLTNSTCVDEGTEGVYVESSNWFMLSNNTITGTTGDGIFIDGSDMFFVADNNLSGNSIGANFANSQNFSFEDNNITSNTNMGVSVESSDDFGIRNNTCYEGDIGIGVFISNGSIERNTLVNLNLGVYAVQANYADIGRNNCSYDVYGIYVDSSSNTNIWNNTCSWSTSAGIYAYAVTNSRISNNNCSNGTSVLLLVYSDHNEISNNICSGNSMMGIDLEVASWNIIQNNKCDWNYDGIYLAASLGNTISYNWCGNNTNYGIEVTSGSDGNVVSMNMVCDNQIKGIQIGLSKDAVITYNFCRSNQQGGIAIEASINATLAWNMLVHNGVWIGGNLPEYWYSHSINQTNMVNGRPVVYIANQTSVSVTENAGQVLVANSHVVLADTKLLTDATVGLEAGFSDTILLNNSDCGMNYYGTYFYQSTNFAASNCSYGSSDTGFYADMCTYMMVDNCTFSSGSTGIYLNSVSNGYVKDNNIVNELYGMNLNSDDGIQIWDNLCNLNSRGISLTGSSYIDINNNTCSQNSAAGIYLDQSDYNRIDNNTCSDNIFGIYLFYTGHCDLKGNTMVRDGLYLYGSNLEDWTTHSISTTNTANGRPVYYFSGASYVVVPTDGGQVILAGCSWMSVPGGNLSNASVGVSLGYTQFTQITGVDCSGGYNGAFLYHSSDGSIDKSNMSNVADCGLYSLFETFDSITNSTFASNRIGVFASQTSEMHLAGNLFLSNEEEGVRFGSMATQNHVWNNTFAYNNGALDNSSGSFLQAYDGGGGNSWYDSDLSRGNYWNDWTSPDSEGDGIVDNPYNIRGTAGSRDMYPLVSPTSPFQPIPEFGLLLVIPLVMLLVALFKGRDRKA